MLFQYGDFIAAVLVQSDFADTQYIGPVQIFRQESQDFLRQRKIFGFLRIQSDPAVMLYAETRSASGLN